MGRHDVPLRDIYHAYRKEEGKSMKELYQWTGQPFISQYFCGRHYWLGGWDTKESRVDGTNEQEMMVVDNARIKKVKNDGIVDDEMVLSDGMQQPLTEHGKNHHHS
jgi:hypothetical protein